MIFNLRELARPGLYVVEFPLHVKVGQSTNPLFRLGTHGMDGALRAWLSPAVTDVELAEAELLRMASARTGVLYRKQMCENFPDLPFLVGVEIAQEVADMFSPLERVS